MSPTRNMTATPRMALLGIRNTDVLPARSVARLQVDLSQRSLGYVIALVHGVGTRRSRPNRSCSRARYQTRFPSLAKKLTPVCRLPVGAEQRVNAPVDTSVRPLPAFIALQPAVTAIGTYGKMHEKCHVGFVFVQWKPRWPESICTGLTQLSGKG